MDFDSIVSRHFAAMAADAESSKLKSSIPDDPLVLRSPAVASPATPRQFSLGRDSLSIPLDDDVSLLPGDLHTQDAPFTIILAGAPAAAR
jgi:hypothetical protein